MDCDRHAKDAEKSEIQRLPGCVHQLPVRKELSGNTMNLSVSKIRYLLTIDRLSKADGTTRSIDIAVQLGVSRPSVHRTLAQLAELGLVVKKPRQSVWLTALGAELVQNYHQNYDLLQQHLIAGLQLPLFEAEEITSFLVCSLDPIYVERLCQALKPH